MSLDRWGRWRVPVIPATGRRKPLDGGILGVLQFTCLCRSGVHTKLCVNMGVPWEHGMSRLIKEERTGPGWKHSRQKFPR